MQSDLMAHIPVSVSTGKWVCDVDGSWDFSFCIGTYGKTINVANVNTFSELTYLVRKEFSIDEQSFAISFWSPDVSTHLSQSPSSLLRIPPVSITGDCDVVKFLSILKRRPETNLYLTVEDLELVKTTPPNALTDDVGNPQINSSQALSDDDTMLSLVFQMEEECRRKQIQGPETTLVYGCPEQTTPPCPLVGIESIGSESNSVGASNRKVTASPTQFNGDRVEPTQTTPCVLTQRSSFDLGIENRIEVGFPVNQTAPISENVLVEELTAEDFDDPPPQLRYLPQPEDSGLVYVGRMFPNKKEFHLSMSMLALQQFFCYKTHHSDKSRINVKCVDPSCKWRVYAKVYSETETIEVTKYTPLHTCGVESRGRYVEKATSKVIAQLLNPKFSNGKVGPRAHQIPEVVLSELKVSVTYMKAWYAKEAAVATARGQEEQSFRLLTEYLQLLVNANPGTLTDIVYSSDSAGMRRFKYLFVAFGAAIAGWPYVRKVVGVDGTQLKGKYKGCLLTASCQDGNMQILPLAFGVVDSENEDSWTWFLDNLTQIVDDDESLVLVSDRHLSIRTAVKKVYPNTRHVICVVHLVRNVKHQFKCEGLASMVNMAARAFTMTDFRYWWNQIQNISPECAQYLVEAGFARWTRVHCQGERYNLMSSNICESLNHALGPAVSFPIITLVEFVRTLLMRWFATRREQSVNCSTQCTPTIEKLLVEYLQTSADMQVLPASHTYFRSTIREDSSIL